MNNERRQALSCSDPASAAIHLDLDGMHDIYAAHRWKRPDVDDTIFESGLTNFLDFFDRNKIFATLFVVANALEDSRKLPLLKEAVDRGHEIASHSLTHANLRLLTHQQKDREIGESRQKIERSLQVKVRGFRAPGFQIDRECLELLSHYEYEYDCSVYPNKTFASRLEISKTSLAKPFRPLPEKQLMELPLPQYGPMPFPFHPSYSLVLGFRYFHWGLSRFRKGRKPLVLLFHLIDLAEPLQNTNLRGWTSKWFTLSTMSSQKKRESCQKMLDLVRQHYKIESTLDILQQYKERV